jgi:hypothetical protein
VDRLAGMRGEKQSQVSVTCLINEETMIPGDHPIRAIKQLLNEVLAQMDAYFDDVYTNLPSDLASQETEILNHRFHRSHR